MKKTPRPASPNLALAAELAAGPDPTAAPSLTVAMHGVTGRMGTNQHFLRSILPIMKQGGVLLPSGQHLQVEPILVGRDEAKVRRLAEEVAVEETGSPVDWTTSLEDLLDDRTVDIVFDSAATPLRPSIVRLAAEHGKAVYCEKPVATTAADAYALAADCEAAGIKTGVVQDKLWLPGIQKLRKLRDDGFFGRILSVRGEFGYWVFSGHDPDRPPQRPSWNYRREDGGGMIMDMYCHWQYLIEDLFGEIASVMTHASIDIPERIDEQGRPYACTADDAAYAMFQLQNGIVCQFNSSWTTRVRRDDLLTIQVDGTKGSAVAGLRDCWTQSATETPRPTWNPDLPQPLCFLDAWQPVADEDAYDNAYKIQWELFLKHVAGEGEFPWSIRAAAAGVALAEAGERSWKERRWVPLDGLRR
ncbi:Gfo/Idh/MocA family protein [Candidatus Laterigemmans baculatus]|nr:Gfo/Idh/MocA family oxidoreductase [Candidatus Laterigemmans baculatus]